MEACTEPAGSDGTQGYPPGARAQPRHTRSHCAFSPVSKVSQKGTSPYARPHSSRPSEPGVSPWSSPRPPRRSESPPRPESERSTFDANSSLAAATLKKTSPPAPPPVGQTRFLILKRCFLPLVLLEAENTGICLQLPDTTQTQPRRQKDGIKRATTKPGARPTSSLPDPLAGKQNPPSRCRTSSQRKGLLAWRAEDSRSGFSVCGRGKGYARVVVVVGGGTRVNH